MLLDTASATAILIVDQVARIRNVPETSDILYTIGGGAGGIETVSRITSPTSTSTSYRSAKGVRIAPAAPRMSSLQAVYHDVSETTGNLHSENCGDFL